MQADAVILAISIKGMQKLVANSPQLSAHPEFRRVYNLKGIDVIATRLWFDKLVPTQFSSNVLSGFGEDVGGTFFNLNDLQVCALFEPTKDHNQSHFGSILNMN